MPASSPPPDIAVVGAGALGLGVAAELALRGHRVSVIDPGGPNASSVAAGMLAPAMESVLDDCSPERVRLLRAARDLWPEFARRTGVSLHREGAHWSGEGAAEVAARLTALGFIARLDGDEVFTPEDWRLDPAVALSILTKAPGVERISDRVGAVVSHAGGWRLDGEAGVLTAPVVVIAAGWSASTIVTPEAARRRASLIQPIRGQIERLAGPAPSAVRRGEDGYVAPSVGGLVAGASMQPDETDLSPDLLLAERHTAMAARQMGAACRWVRSDVGVRGASPDGLPLAGVVAPGLALALAPRRNGWLLAPLVARTVADALDGSAPGPWAAALDPARFA